MTEEATQLRQRVQEKLRRFYNLVDESVSPMQLYHATAAVLCDDMLQRNNAFKRKATQQGAKRVYYISMEYLIGRNMRNTLFNLNLEEEFAQMLAGYGLQAEDLYALERDPGLGNGGLGRLAACYLDALSAQSIPATGFSILYEYGIFRQKIVDGRQTELPDEWLPSGEAWLQCRNDEAVEVHFGGWIEESWQNGRMQVTHHDYSTVLAVPYTLPIPGYRNDAVNELRLWKAKAATPMDLSLFSAGQYNKAVEQNAMAEVISKVLYPADNHFEGKSLRLKQQYFLVSSAVQYILRHHFDRYGSFDSLPDMAAIQINDTHPAMVIPEMMRILLDEYAYSWEQAWSLVTRTVSYTNHTVLPEALEQWSSDLFRMHLPRIYAILAEINRRFCLQAAQRGLAWDRIRPMAILQDDRILMANLSVIGSHCVNGVSSLHSKIIQDTVFHDFACLDSSKFTNVTNGVAHRRWLCQANPRLDELLCELIGVHYRTQPQLLRQLENYADDDEVLQRLHDIKQYNKKRLAALVYAQSGVSLNEHAIFDVQVKRLHEYKRQLMNVLRIVMQYQEILAGNLPAQPQVCLFGAKASGGYAVAKRIIQLIHSVAAVVNHDPRVGEWLKVVFLEDYRVSTAEIIIPGADLSEQISQAGKEASGTGNMKFMLNGALTIGTLDGANVEILELVGEENMFLFGLTATQVAALAAQGYQPTQYYQQNPALQNAADAIAGGAFGEAYHDLMHDLLTRDPFMVVADLQSYCQAHTRAQHAYADTRAWQRSALYNIARAGFFAADRSVREYADTIWNVHSI